MERDLSRKKVDAIYELREAAEQKVLAEQRLSRAPSSEARDALLEARLTLESKTQDAIDVCHECGQPHLPGSGHS